MSDLGEPLDSAPELAGSDPSVPRAESDPRFRLDPARLPKRLDLAVDDTLLTQLEAMAARSGRCIDEIVVELLDRQNSKT